MYVELESWIEDLVHISPEMSWARHQSTIPKFSKPDKEVKFKVLEISEEKYKSISWLQTNAARYRQQYRALQSDDDKALM